MNTLLVIIKGLGMALVVACTTGIGFTMAGTLQKRVRALETALAFSDALEAELAFRLSPPGQAVGELAHWESFSCAPYLLICADYCTQGMPFPKAWRRSLHEKSGALGEEDVIILLGLADVLGQSDLEGQRAALMHVKSTLEPRLEQARETQRAQGKLYKTLGLLLGCAIVIVGV